MLTKYSDSFEIVSSNRIFNVKSDDTTVSVSDTVKEGSKSEDSDNLTFGTESSTLNSAEESNRVIELNTVEKCTVPEGFQVLPEDLFVFERIPPPLVSSSWLKLLDSDEECGEDSIPLATLKKKIKNKGIKKAIELASPVESEDLNVHKNSRKKRKRKKENDYAPIKRKRGRPKKELTEKTTPVEDDFRIEENEEFWNEETNASNCDVPDPVINIDSDNSNAVGNNDNEHDYFKQVKQEDTEEVNDANKKENEKKKRKRTPIQGVKIGDSKISFPCLECGKSFSAASTLKCHQRLHNGTLLICPECHKGFVSKYLLKCHMRIHNGDLFMCHKCGRGFTTAELLKVHSRAHTGDRPFVCNICGKSFPTSSNMLQHKQIHNSEKKFLCSQCGSSFVQKRCLDYHMLTHSEKKNICNACGKLWARKSDLVEHMRVHTGVKPYCCSICPQKFSQASSLKRHQLVHMDVKSIQCGTCFKMFKCQEYYKRHLRKHEKEDYSC